MIQIDGTTGEGGGQILRSSLSLSVLTQQAFEIEGIRGGRKKPGLLRQHLTAVNAAKAISDAETSGDTLGSLHLRFAPREIKGGTFHFSVGTAGSAILVLQTVLPPLMTAPQASKLILEGGTHNPFAPPFDFLEHSFLPLINRMGPNITVTLEQFGFFPAGGGRLTLSVEPASTLDAINILSQDAVESREATIISCQLPPEIPKRQKRMLRNKLNWLDSEVGVRNIRRSSGPGNVAIASLRMPSHTEVFSGFGGPHTPSSKVIENLVSQVREYQSSDAPIGEYLADQLMLPCALARGDSSYNAVKASSHAITNQAAIESFLSKRIEITKAEDGIARFSFQTKPSRETTSWASTS